MAAPVRVLLIWPGTDGAAAGNFGCPQLVGMATYLRRETGAQITIVDLYAERALGTVDLGRLFAGEDGRGYDVVGFSCYSSFDFLKLEAIAEIARPLLPDAVFVAGGYHVSARPTDFVYDGSPFDVAVIGEGELAMVKVVESVAGGAPLRATIMPSEPVADLDDLPVTDWSYLARYRAVARRVTSQAMLYLSRGCPFDCAFCMERAKRETSWRPLSVDRALDELARAHAYFDLRGMTVYAADALFGMRKRWRREFLDRLAASRVPYEKLWLLVRVDMIDDEDLRQFGAVDAALGFGLESGDPAQLATIRKAGRLEDYLERMTHVAAKARELDVPWGANVIVGHPGETEATLRTSARYLSELFLDPRGTTGFLSVDPFRLYPGSPIDDERQAWEARFGTVFHRPTWWKDGDQEFLAEWVDPSAELDYRRRAELSHELYGPILRGIAPNYSYRGNARAYFMRAVEEQIRNLDPAIRLHFLGRYYAWNRYLGRGPAARERLGRDDDATAVCRAMRVEALPAIATRLGWDDETRARFEGSPLAEALREVPRERFAPLDAVVESTQDRTLALDDSGAATVSAMHAYVRTFQLAEIGPDQRVLDLGGGTGYGAALLHRLVGAGGLVVTVELDPALSEKARALVDPAVRVVAGDALAAPTREAIEHAAEGSLFDAVTVGFALTRADVEALLRYVRDGGCVVAPVEDEGGAQHLWVTRRARDGVRATMHDRVLYVPRRRVEDLPATKPSGRGEGAAKKRLALLAR